MNEEDNIAPINEDLNVVQYDVNNIKNLIYTIRGKQVMLDSDVAMLYHYETKKINQTVKRNIARFPERFCFQLTKEEFEFLRSQIVTLNLKDIITEKRVTRKYLPYVFTEQGISMLSGLLKNDIAIQVSVNIMDAFVEMRKFLANSGQVFERLTNVEYKLIDIIKRANEKIIIIDNYIDDSILKMLTKKNKSVKVVILTSDKTNILKLDIQKFNKEYTTLVVAKTNIVHDRFVIIDNKELYHIGASLKDLGKKCFAISKIEDISYIEILNSKYIKQIL